MLHIDYKKTKVDLRMMKWNKVFCSNWNRTRSWKILYKFKGLKFKRE